MVRNLARKLQGVYTGELARSSTVDPEPINITIKALSPELIKLEFALDENDFSFRGMVIEKQEDILLQASEKVTPFGVVKGVSGFLYQQPGIHGGFLDKLRSFYFHVSVNYFDNGEEELYFLGKICPN